MYQEPVRRIKVPPNQLKLTETEQKEEIARVLTANDPNVPNNIAKYNFKEKVYKKDPPATGDHLARHFTMDGPCMHKAREQGGEAAAGVRGEGARGGRAGAQGRGGGGGGGRRGGLRGGRRPAGGEEPVQLQRAPAQTFNNPMKAGRGDGAPPVVTFCATVTQWEIYDFYMADYMRVLAEQEALAGGKDKKKGGGGAALGARGGRRPAAGRRHGALAEDGQRAQDPRAHGQPERRGRDLQVDFKYWEDAGPVPHGRGRCCRSGASAPTAPSAKQVTALGWNPRYPDLFAAAYGSYDFLRQGAGAVCLFSLKNTAHPEYLFATESGALCLDFHPQHASLLAVGCYDGTVMVYDVRNKGNKPIYSSSIKTGKHTDPVWQVHWQEEDLAKELNFYSVSSDGRVGQLDHEQNELKMEPVMQLRLVARLGDPRRPRSPGWRAAAASTSTARPSTCSWWAPRRARCTSAARPTRGSTWRPTRGTTWPCTRCGGTPSTSACS
ncbi:unnamed protein product [Heterosigma akashiwo]